MESDQDERYCFWCKGWVREGCGKAYVRNGKVIIVHGGVCEDEYERRNPNNVLFLG